MDKQAVTEDPARSEPGGVWLAGAEKKAFLVEVQLCPGICSGGRAAACDRKRRCRGLFLCGVSQPPLVLEPPRGTHSASISVFGSRNPLPPDLSGVLSSHPVHLSLLRGHKKIPVLDVMVTPTALVVELSTKVPKKNESCNNNQAWPQ